MTKSDDANPFPRWIRRLDPLLEAGSENHLYLLFRERRRTGKGGARFVNLAVWLYVLLCILLMLGVVPGIQYFMYLNVLFPVILLVAGRKRKTGVGQYVSQVAFAPLENKQVLMDLWSTQCNGALLLEAAYLEQREASVRFCLIVTVLIPIGSLLYFWKVGTGFQQVTAFGAILMLLLAMMLHYLKGGGSLSYPRLARVLARTWNDPGIKANLRLSLTYFPFLAVMFLFIIASRFGLSTIGIYTGAAIGGTVGAVVFLLLLLWRRLLSEAELSAIRTTANQSLDRLVRERLSGLDD